MNKEIIIQNIKIEDNKQEKIVDKSIKIIKGFYNCFIR